MMQSRRGAGRLHWFAVRRPVNAKEPRSGVCFRQSKRTREHGTSSLCAVSVMEWCVTSAWRVFRSGSRTSSRSRPRATTWSCSAETSSGRSAPRSLAPSALVLSPVWILVLLRESRDAHTHTHTHVLLLIIIPILILS
eukprot:2623692-Rhodomonas_salina.1